MEFDFQNPITFPGVLVYPDWAGVDQPKAAADIKETVFIGGSSTGGSLNVGGIVDE